MGLCATSDRGSPEDQALDKDERQKSKAIENKLAEERSQQIHKLLLLGAGGSGKSTLFKQMIAIYGNGFPESERRNFTPIIFSNIILSMKTLCEQSDKWGQVQHDNQESKRFFLQEIGENDEVTEEVGQHIKKLWRDPGILATYEKRNKFQLTDSTAYFFGRIDHVMKPDYVPDEQDVLRSRVPTTGIVENSFDVDGSSFKMYDVGGQRSERKKWIHCFENVTAVLFVAAISAYDQVLYEDETTNRMEEALNLFEEISNSEWFENTSMILFLNKRDIFAEKIEKIPLADYFPTFKGGNNYEEAADFIQSMFESRNQTKNEVYTHLTCATDTNHIWAVFNSVKDIIIKRGLHKAGLIA